LRFFARQVKSVFGDDVVSLVLFGDQACGGAGQNSEIDVRVIFKSIPDRRVVRDRLAALAYEALLAHGEDVQAVAITQDQWDFPETFTNPSLIQAIKREGLFFLLTQSSKLVQRSRFNSLQTCTCRNSHHADREKFAGLAVATAK
jgi:hypothetical protein